MYSFPYHWLVISYLLAFFHISYKNPIFSIVLLFILLVCKLKLQVKITTCVIIFSVHLISFLIIPHPSPLLQTDNTSNDQIEVYIQSSVVATNHYTSFIGTSPQFNQEPIQFYHFVSSEEEELPIYKVGATCVLKGEISSALHATNTGEFTYDEYLSKKGLAGQYNIEELLHCEGQGIVQYLFDLKGYVINHIDRYVDDFTLAWIEAMIFGNRKYLDQETTEVFQEWGLTHLLAISGLHIGLLLMMFYFVFLYIVKMTVERVHFLLLCFLPIYPIIAGSQPSVWRASILAILLILIRKWKIRLPTISLLSIVFLLLVCIDLYIIYQLGFQFSFFVTYAILLSKRIVIHNEWGIFTGLKISLLSMFIILPIQLNAFYQFQPLSVVMNLFVIPYFSFFVLPFLLLILFVSISPTMLHLFSNVFHFVHEYFLTILLFLDQHISMIWTVGKLHPLLIILFYSCLLLFFIYFEQKKYKRTFFFGNILVLLLMVQGLLPYIQDKGTVTMLDIGQGDAIVIELPYRKGVYLIDLAGKMNYDYSRASDKTYKQIIHPFLQSKGITHINGLFLSHADLDHIGSVEYLLAHYTVDYIFTSPFFSETITNQYKEINTQFKHKQMKQNDRIQIGDWSLHVLHPKMDLKETNANSLVMYTELGGFKWLFTGDITEKEEKALIQNYPELDIDILKVAHHGSKTSTSTEFLQKITPTISLISVGRDNRYQHPNTDVIEKLCQSSTVFRTDQHGAIYFNFTDQDGTFLTHLPYDNVNNSCYIP